MKTAFRYNRDEGDAVRPPRGYVRWLGFWLRALARLLRGGPGALRPVWTEDRGAELLAAGFPALLAVPEPLFASLAAALPDRPRLRAEGSEEELLAAIRRLEARSGLRFDWDAFLAACARRDRRADALQAWAEKLAALAPPRLGARTPQEALRALAEARSKPERNRPI